MLAQGPVLQCKGTGSDRMFAEILTPFFDGFFGHDMGEVQRHFMQEGRIGLVQGELDGVIVNNFDPRKAVGFARGFFGKAFDGVKETGTRALGFRVVPGS